MNQRLGHIIEHRAHGAGPSGRAATYLVHDDETGEDFGFAYTAIVTEGFRHLRKGERVRFLTDPGRPGHAFYIVQLDLPEVEAYY
ncbi:hypothetical protein AB0L06_41870 [Spirillospora sp. NPDC052269]